MLIFSSLTGDRLTHLPIDYLWNVVRKPIRFRQAIQEIDKLHQSCLYIDVGPSATLGNFVKHNLTYGSDSKVINIMAPYYINSREVEVDLG
ncbi:MULTISPECIES: hypothetical protein [Bacillus amyloliquefaciens group]|mgnify:CR=1 FL=1|uniref:hypothetical protein n=1 Tax=Bacillus amyloliquefaciens group TaxID=1938374 RepID=UPI0010725423|nr:MULTISPECIES: hypothetical protein [Bacillus amyloliquefaciens group]MBI0442636.1 hypothetical protein [Bacillus velezensis]MCC9262729.1 hypothetical protein [Bacillus velezensis]MCM8506879.1 hypothetical protein [Bacillus amyloliquefaciens]MCT6683375.1 hypothetical protein [Bacillus velezensis]NIH03078.1 hypothetical protein [Bacillus amyloliquefaciens]